MNQKQGLCCIDCEEFLREDERKNVCTCDKCGGQMHYECLMHYGDARGYCERCFYEVATLLVLKAEDVN